MNYENDLIQALGMAGLDDHMRSREGEGQEVPHHPVHTPAPRLHQPEEGMGMSDSSETDNSQYDGEYDLVPDPKANQVDLSDLRGVKSSEKGNNNGDPSSKDKKMKSNNNNNDDSETELEALAELLPDIKHRRRYSSAGADNNLHADAANVMLADIPQDEDGGADHHSKESSKLIKKQQRKLSMESNKVESISHVQSNRNQSSLKAQESGGDDMDQSSRAVKLPTREVKGGHGGGGGTRAVGGGDGAYHAKDEASSGGHSGDDSLDNYPESDLVMEDEGHHVVAGQEEPEKVPKAFMNMNNLSSAQSISTATQTHEVRMPMYLPTFKPATGCTNASDFIVRCFVARLRSGITVVKHGRSRWCKSRLRVLHIHPDGRSLSWKPAEGEPASSRRPPKLDLSTCLEVRHAWSPDPQNPMYTGTQILRQKCEAANAHKSFALIFKARTVDITAVTADQCKVLMEGFSALCFRLQVANLAGRGTKAKGAQARPMPEEDGVSTTASATLTNTSTPRAR